MVYSDCVVYDDGYRECYQDGFWYTNKGILIKWIILGIIFLFFTLWFFGGYLHAKSRMKKGLPLLSYHRWLVPYNERKRFGQVPQNHFTFYEQQPGYGPPQGQPYYAQRPDGSYPDAPPMYNGDSPPGYAMPSGASKMNPNQNGQNGQNGQNVEMPQYGVPPPPPMYTGGQQPVGAQQTGVVGGGYAQDVEQGQSQPPQDLPPRPQQAKLAFTNFVSRFKK